MSIQFNDFHEKSPFYNYFSLYLDACEFYPSVKKAIKDFKLNVLLPMESLMMRSS